MSLALNFSMLDVGLGGGLPLRANAAIKYFYRGRLSPVPARVLGNVDWVGEVF